MPVQIRNAQAVPHDDISMINLANEHPVLLDLLNRLGESDIVYDIGAAAGLYTCLCADLLSSERVVAFEPSPQAREVLNRNLHRNGLLGLPVYSYALSDEDGTMAFEPIKGQLRTERCEAGGDLIEVRTIGGDELISSEQLEAPTVIKIDVEEAELAVICGLQETLLRSACRLIYCEVHPDDLPEFEADGAIVVQTLQEIGFSVEYINEMETVDAQYGGESRDNLQIASVGRNWG